MRLVNSNLNFTNNSLTNCNFYSEYFLSIEYEFNAEIQTPFTQIQECIFDHIFTINQVFIFISDANALNFQSGNLIFRQITLNGPLFYLKNVNKSFIDKVEIFGVNSNQFLQIFDSDFVQLQNVLLYSTHIFFGESIIYFENTIYKIINNLTLVNSRNFVTTPGIKIIQIIPNTNSKTLINKSVFYNNSINYFTNDDIGSALFISSENEELTIENSLFLQNNLLPGFSDIKIGGACMRTFGKNIQIYIKNSIFNGNKPVFDCNCIQFNGNILVIVQSYFLGNINFIQPTHKTIVDSFGYGGSIYAVCQNLTINDSFFTQNMNYYGGTIYFYK